MNKPVEKLTGLNRAQVEFILGRVHVMESNLTAVRIIRRSIKGKKWRGIPYELRRGVIATVIEIHGENRQMYLDVVRGRI